jgi:hypothetical protein
MSTPVQIAGRPLTVRLARVALWVILIAAAIVALLTIIGDIVGIVANLSARTTTVTLIAEKALPRAANGETTRIVRGTYDTATVVLSHAPGAVAVLGILAAVGQMLAQAGLAAATGLVAWRVLRPRMFRRSLSVQFSLMGALVFLGGVLWQLGAMFAGGLAAVSLNSSADDRGFWPLAGRLDPTYIVVGFALVTIGLAFEYGERLQKEAEGLV